MQELSMIESSMFEINWHSDVIVIDNLINFEPQFFVSTKSIPVGHPSRVSNPE